MRDAESAIKLKIQSGFECGYNTPLASAREDINLTSGTHYLLGRNGKGKTTLLRTLARLMPAFSGEFTKPKDALFLPEDLVFDSEL